MQNSNNLDEFISEASEENKKQPLPGIRKKLTFSSETEAFSASSRIKFGDVEHYLKNGICSSLLSNFIWSTNKMAINLHRATTQEGGGRTTGISAIIFDPTFWVTYFTVFSLFYPDSSKSCRYSFSYFDYSYGSACY